MSSLFELTEEVIAVEDSLDGLFEKCREAGREPTAEEIKEFFEYTASLGVLVGKKLDSYCYLIKRLVAEQAIAKAEAEEWAAKAAARDRKQKYLKDVLKWHLESVHQPKVQTERFKISICNNGGKAPVEIVDVHLIPPELLYFPDPYPAKDAIREELELGHDVPGAKLGERGTHVRIS